MRILCTGAASGALRRERYGSVTGVKLRVYLLKPRQLPSVNDAVVQGE
jgi:hypothetical protein